MKNKLYLAFFIFSVFVVGIFTAILLIILDSNMSSMSKYFSVTLLIILILSVFATIILATFMIVKKRENIRKSFDSYIEESISTVGVGLVIFNDSADIIWISKFIQGRVNKKLIGTKLNHLSTSFGEQFQKGNSLFRFELDGVVFRAQIDFNSKTLILKDITNEAMIMHQYSSEKSVIAEMEIDNFQQLQVILPEEELFKVRSSVIKLLDSLVDNYNLIYRQYVNGKFLIYFNKAVLDRFAFDKFKFLDKIRSVKVMDGVQLSVSIGIGAGSSHYKELIDLAKDGLLQSLARGGDQVAVMEPNKKPVYYGSKSETAQSSSRVRIKQISKIIEDKLKLKTIKKVVIYGHVFADLDAVGSAMGVYALAKEFNKEVYIQNNTFDSTTEKTLEKFFSKEEREIFIKKTRATRMTGKNDTLVIIVDTADLSRIENDKALDGVKHDNVFILDHHRVSKLPNDIPSVNVYIDTTASSASEIVTEVIQFISKSVKPSKKYAQMLLNGIYLDTKQFTNSTSSRTFAAASWLEGFGASSGISSEILKLPEKYSSLVAEILSSVKEVKKGYFLSSYPGEVPQDIISLAADEILRVQGRYAAFVIAKLPGKQEFKMSARGINTNVQVIAEAVGGGGHFGASAAVSKEPLTIFEDNIIQSIVSLKEGD
ncbi:MAG: DHH family phosphoesterase [Mycoplasmatales bacterium]|nr:DHH family phosphoesterase [Mycoplasmatales bacterium]